MLYRAAKWLNKYYIRLNNHKISLLFPIYVMPRSWLPQESSSLPVQRVSAWPGASVSDTFIIG